MTTPERLRVGTSGWNYGDWKGLFYPQDVRSRDYLAYYARHFDTTEVNYSFYHLPRPSTYQNWAAQVPDDFIFAVKASRFITHIKRLVDVEDAWKQFLDNASELGPRLGPILLQFPPSFRLNLDLLAGFLKLSRRLIGKRPVKLALEFRHASCFDPQVCELLRQHDAALVVAQSERYPQALTTPTASFAYLRFHGPGRLFASLYSEAGLKPWGALVRGYLTAGLPAYAYFNNDFHGYALTNARHLLSLTTAPENQ